MGDWYPNSDQQVEFLSSPAFEAFFGGAAGPGKTECVVREALRQIWHPLYTGIIFRRTFPMLEAARSIVQRSQECYPTYGGVYNDQKHYWKFPRGSRIYFGHMQHIKDMLNYQSAEFTFVAFDELTEFEEEQYLYMFTRCRVPAGAYEPLSIGGIEYPPLVAYVRSASNPGNIGHRWVKKRFVSRDIANRLRWFASVKQPDGSLVDTEVPRDHTDELGEPDALSRAFYPAKLSDNPDADPNYRMRIRATGDPVRIAQLEHGDWDAENLEGRIYGTWSSSPWPGGNVCAEADYNPDLPVYWACDDGYVYGDGPGSITYHPRVILFMQDNTIGGLDVIDEYVATEENHATTLKNVLLPQGDRYPDGSAPEELRRWHHYRRPEAAYLPSEAALMRGEMHNFGIMTVNSTHRVTEGIKAMRLLIGSAEVMRSLRVNPRCTNFLFEIGEYRSDEKGRADTGEIVPMKMNDHCMDAARYLIFKRRHMRNFS